jgi:hypothetical protein
MLRYLPLQAGPWVVAVPLSAVVEVRAFIGSDSPGMAAMPDSSSPSSVGVPAVSLSALLGDTAEGSTTKFGILLNCRKGIFCLLAEGITLPQVALSVDPLPLILQDMPQLFSDVVVQTDDPVLLLNVESIGHNIYQAAAQERKADAH